MVKRNLVSVLALSVLAAVAAAGASDALDVKAYQWREDFGSEPEHDFAFQYYYYIPSPTYSWFWGVSGWDPSDMVGRFFETTDQPFGQSGPWNSDADNWELHCVRCLDFAGYGTLYPGLFTVEFSVWCADESGCPVGLPVWTGGPVETSFGWNYIQIDNGRGRPLNLCACRIDPTDDASPARILVTATHVGTDCTYPQWGFDNMSTPVEAGDVMHDIGCLPALYPRPLSSYYPEMHSGHHPASSPEGCSPTGVRDGRDSTAGGTEYGCVELAWRLYFDYAWT
jgi:hypothetical protein